MTTLTLPSPEPLQDWHPQARQQYTDQNGRTNVVMDTRPPLHRLRRAELLKLAADAGYDVSSMPVKTDLIKMLEAPRSVLAQVGAGRNLKQAKEEQEARRAAPQARPAPEMVVSYLPREPEPHEIEAAKDAARQELMKMPYFKLKAALASRGISYGQGVDRQKAVEQYIRAIDDDQEQMLSHG